jgi:hypothetical protein
LNNRIALVYCKNASEHDLLPLTSITTYILLIRRKPVIDARRHNHQIVLIERDPHPLIPPATHIEKAAPIHDIANLLVLVQVFLEESPDLLLVHTAHGGRRNRNLVAVPVAPRGRDGVYIVDGRVVEVQDAEAGQVFRADAAARVVGFALVALMRWSDGAVLLGRSGSGSWGGVADR